MKQLTLSRDRVNVMPNPYRPDSMTDARSIIYAAAFMGAARAGLIPLEDVFETVRTVVLPRPQLSHIDGKPC